jgi:hypothetical protein
MSYMIDKPPTEDPVLLAGVRPWELPEHRPSLSASRAAFKTYSTLVLALRAMRTRRERNRQLTRSDVRVCIESKRSSIPGSPSRRHDPDSRRRLWSTIQRRRLNERSTAARRRTKPPMYISGSRQRLYSVGVVQNQYVYIHSNYRLVLETRQAGISVT